MFSSTHDNLCSQLERALTTALATKCENTFTQVVCSDICSKLASCHAQWSRVQPGGTSRGDSYIAPLSVLSFSATLSKVVTAEVRHLKALHASEELEDAGSSEASLGRLVQSVSGLLVRVSQAVLLPLPVLEGGRQPGCGSEGRPSGPPWHVDPDISMSIISNLLRAMRQVGAFLVNAQVPKDSPRTQRGSNSWVGCNSQ
jgi:hypothetical protein